MDTHFLSWDEPIVRSTIKIRNDDEFLSWDRPVLVNKEQADDCGGVAKASSLNWGAPTSKSVRRGKFQSGERNRNASVNLNKLTGKINSASKRIQSLAICFELTNSVM
jgi:hypothetical protein